MHYLIGFIENKFDEILIGMSILAIFVFIALFFVKAGYGRFVSRKWGALVNNKLGWVLMEAPVFILMLMLWLSSDRVCSWPHIILLLLFEVHYLQRAFIFPFLIRGKGKMSVLIILMGFIFNSVNAIMQGGWIFYVSPEDYYTFSWLYSPQFIIGTVMFVFGMVVNMNSDHIIRHLRKPGDTSHRHYIPKGGMFRYVSSANYFGEFIEWAGFAVLTWSLSGAVFALWTFANLAPRADAIYKSYEDEFGDEFKRLKLKRILPFIW